MHSPRILPLSLCLPLLLATACAGDPPIEATATESSGGSTEIASTSSQDPTTTMPTSGSTSGSSSSGPSSSSTTMVDPSTSDASTTAVDPSTTSGSTTGVPPDTTSGTTTDGTTTDGTTTDGTTTDGTTTDGTTTDGTGDNTTGAPPCMMDNDCDGDLCNTAACVNSQCQLVPIPISDDDACTDDACDPMDGTITHTPVDVDDQNVCTDDACDPMMGVTHTLLPVPSDNNVCTADTCDPVLGEQHLDKPCNDNNLCTSDTCDPQMGCKFTVNPIAPDNLGCTTDTCDIMTGNAVYTPVANCCEHTQCVEDGPLDAVACTYTGANNDCATKVCQAKPECCNSLWDAACVAAAKDPAICPTGLDPTNFTCDCPHSPCVTGVKLVKTCDPCVKKICEVDPFCCNNSWDGVCQSRVNSVCRIPLGMTCK